MAGVAMATDFNRTLAEAKKSIRENGREFIAVTETQSGDDWNPTISTTETPFIGMQVGFEASELAQGLVADGDIKILAAGDIAQPVMGQTIKDGADVYRVKRFNPVKPGLITVLYKIHCER